MGKYGDLIQQAKAEAAEAEIRQDVKPSTRKAVNTELRKNVKTAKREDVRPESRKAGKRDQIKWADAESLITVGAKVPPAVAQHWIIEAKRQRTSLTYVITKALLEAFGAPDGAIIEED